MSTDQGDKTEDATEKKLRDAREGGNVPLSRELPVACALIGVTLVVVVTAGSGVRAVAQMLATLFDHISDIRILGLGDAVELQRVLFWGAGVALLPSLALLMVSGLVGGILQRPLNLTPGRLYPDVSRISIVQGWKRLFGVSGLMEFLKSALKLILIGTIAAMAVRHQFTNALEPMALEPGQLLEHLRRLCIPILFGVAASIGAVAGLDFIWARQHWLGSLRMTRQEVKDEARESQGDPLVKGRMRAMARQRARSRMMAAVPRATFIIANPTHYAVALRYVRNEGEAPRVLAKGRDLVALRIREIAESLAIPVIEDKPLARALHDVAVVDSIIPQDFYRPVAEIVNYLNRVKRQPASGRLPSQSLRRR
jgi:flagellar biosynthetic protein FlhB